MSETIKDTGLYAIECEDVNEELNAIVLKGDANEFTAQYFLHGVCGIFALALHDRYGYDLWRLDGIDDDVDEDEEPYEFLIHIYCVAPNGQLVDVRGATSDSDKLIDEFLDLCDEDYINGKEMTADECRTFVMDSMSKEEYMSLYNAALSAIDAHESWYKV